MELSDSLKELLGIAETVLTVATGSGEAQAAGDGVSAHTKRGFVGSNLDAKGDYGEEPPKAKAVETNYATGASDSQLYKRKTTQKNDKTHPLYKLLKPGRTDKEVFDIIERTK